MSGAQKTSKLGRGRRALFICIVCTFLFLVLEVGARSFFALKVGSRVWLYGTGLDRQTIEDSLIEAKYKDHTVALHGNNLAGYSKYYPSQNRVDHNPETGESFTVSINSRGFRGAEFSDRKAAGTIRVVTLGASSTFGYYDRDDQTYPVYLEQLLNARSDGQQSFEVINLAIPHMHSENIRSLFFAEVIALAPDVVTFYGGYNDTHLTKKSDRAAAATDKGIGASGSVNRLLRSLYGSALDLSLFLRFANDSITRRFEQFSAADLQNQIAGKAQHFVDNLAAINEECRRRGIVLIVANQQSKSNLIAENDIKGFSYQQEVEAVRNKLSEAGSLSVVELRLLIHSVLMEAQLRWTTSQEIPFVDVIGALNSRRGVLLSEVHLSPEGNQLIAEALTRAVLANLPAPGES